MNMNKTLEKMTEQELKAFKKVFLKAGESQQVSLQVKATDLAFFSEQTNKWVLEPGDFEVLINSASNNNRLKQTINIK